MAKILEKMAEKEETWIVNIVRTNFVFTAMEELKMANDNDWSSPFRVKFLGEEGIDQGGPRREFFSLLLSNFPVFEGKSFSVDSSFLINKDYNTLGKVTSLAILNGHPGPKRFGEHIVNYILYRKEPEACVESDIEREDVLHAIHKVILVFGLV